MFDAFTILVILSAVPLLLGLQFLYFWLRDRHAHWLGGMAALFLLGAVSMVLFAVRGRISDFVSIGISNCLLFAAFGLAWQAMRSFVGRPVILWPVVGAVILWLALCTQPVFLSDLTLRVMVSSVIVGAFSLLCAFELWRGREEGLPSLVPAVIVLTSYGVLTLARIPMAPFVPFPFGAQPMEPGWLAAATLLVLAHLSFLTLLVVSMTKERKEVKQRDAALSDPLTGVLNRRAFALRNLEEQALRPAGARALSLLMLDLDHFKSINDRFGHGVGDKVLTKFAEIAERTIRPTDRIYRVGGEEFCCLLPGAGVNEASIVAERLRKAFATVEFIVDGELLRSTVSIGISSARNGEVSLDRLQAEADAALYRAKASGRNCVIIAEGAELAEDQTATPGPAVPQRRHTLRIGAARRS
ncbi:GGDEF domain-containing protein [Arsenicitalea aurantiaca]|uniref:diguanylate cyclase n=1 Tax=Arsenicitalea aurantiaca TaxID=1783274 RepID=A0A433XG13_9HYPH|nr:GGDEF domain-containing protein [Arsenicitalea aurantiaca]RUT32954.1 GGDEF domain-containing protein [Arsenicitalea aurantiaca]